MVKATKKSKQWKSPARERALDDSEVRALWEVCDEMGGDPYAGVVWCALLTAQRFRKVAQMRRSDLKKTMRIAGRMENGTWIPDQDVPDVWDATREDDPANKKVSVVPLSRPARSVINGVPEIVADKGEDFVFSTTGRSPLRGWSKYKQRLDRKMLEVLRRHDPSATLAPWQHRDLRRTARTIMTRAGVSTEVAEHCLGHVPPLIERTYNRYGYLAEKREAFAKLAEFIENRIINPPDNVVAFEKRDGR
jgi:integrase